MKLGSAFLALISAAIIARGSAIETSLVEADGGALDTNGSRVAASEYGGDSFNYAGSFQPGRGDEVSAHKKVNRRMLKRRVKQAAEAPTAKEDLGLEGHRVLVSDENAASSNLFNPNSTKVAVLLNNTAGNMTTAPPGNMNATPSAFVKSLPSGDLTASSLTSAMSTPQKNSSATPMESSRMKESSMTTRAATSYCGCSFCTQAVWDTVVPDGGGSYSCGSRIKWLQSAQGYSEAAACAKIAAEFQGTCTCNPTSCSGPKVLAPPDPSTLVWSDEFNVDGPPDPRKWGYDIGDGCSIGLCGWGNNENEYYTQSSSNVIVSNGILRITARKQSGFSQPYTSAKLKTRDLRLFKYGRIQFRASMAKCKARGTWPALWMLPVSNAYGRWPNSGEIDVMETVGYEIDQFFQTVHTQVNSGTNGISQKISKSKDGWYTFEVNWEVDRIQFAIDGQVYMEYPRTGGSNVWPFDQDFYIIMNLAVGGNWGGLGGVDANSFEGNGQTMEVDWVRVYSNPNTPGTSPTTATIQAESYRYMKGVQIETTSDVGGGKNVGWIDTGDWMSYPEVTISSTGLYKVEYRVASLGGGGSLQLEKAGGTQVYGRLGIPATGGWQIWDTVSHTVTLNAGPNLFGIKATGGGWNLNWFRITNA